MTTHSPPVQLEKMHKYKEVSMRLMRPTHPEIQIALVAEYLTNWQSSYEMGDVLVYDEGLAQYLLCDRESHHKYYAALILDKPSLRCRLCPKDEDPPVDMLEEAGNKFTLLGGTTDTTEEKIAVQKLIEKLGKKNYKFIT